MPSKRVVAMVTARVTPTDQSRHARERGKYRLQTLDTIKPGPYPNATIPAHVHFTVLEPTRRPYWVDDVVSDGEFGVTDKYRSSMINRGGSGIVTLTKDRGGVLVAKRDIFLERHPATL